MCIKIGAQVTAEVTCAEWNSGMGPGRCEFGKGAASAVPFEALQNQGFS
jgi:hypothetical protein